MTTSLWEGSLTRLVVPNLEELVPLNIQWERDSEFMRLSGSGPIFHLGSKAQKENLENWIKSEYVFLIRTLEGDRPIGLLALTDIYWPAGDAWFAIGIGERDCWGKGYGTDATAILIRYGFSELNLRRISLTVFEYNARAIRSYQKLGFCEEGKARQFLRRDGRYWDMIYMGLLREEWEKTNLLNG